MRLDRALMALAVTALLAGPACAGQAWAGAAAAQLVWGPCPAAAKGAAPTDAFQCAEAKVPIDHAAPGAGSFTLALIRHAATGPAGRIGALLWNPGGPGDAGTDYLPAGIGGFPASVRERFDIISWDPRGMGGRSRPVVQCFDSAAAEAAFMASRFSPGIPATPAELAADGQARADLNARCNARNGDLLAHVSTADNARDLDLLRQALGEDQITYYGTSYGTFLGATYLNMFPTHVRAAILDGGVSPAAWAGNAGEDLSLSTFIRLGSDLGSATTIEAFLAACGNVDASHCAFSAGSPAATRAKWASLLARAKAGSVQYEGEAVSDGAILGYVASAIYLVAPLPGFDRFPGYKAVAAMLQSLWQAGSTPDASTETTAPPEPAATVAETYVTSAGRQLAVVCGESPNPATAEAAARQAEASFGRAGLSAWPFTASCEGWAARAAAPYAGPWDTPLAQPVLVIANSYDPATAFGSSLRLAQALHDARVLPVMGFGHTVLFNPNRCARDYVAAYLVDLQLPPTGAACSEDQPPFAD